MVFLKITIYVNNTIPIHCKISDTYYPFNKTGDRCDDVDEYYAEAGIWGVFYYPNNENDTWVQRRKRGAWTAYKPTHKTLTIVHS